MSYKEDQKLDKKFNPLEIEQRCVDFWEKSGVYAYDVNASREDSYVIDTPPPTVSGSLHIGHIFSYTQTDVMARWNRMRGKNVFYPIGWDDNGLPTERRVQNYYNINCNPNVPYDPNFKPLHDPKDKSLRIDVSRQNFIETCEILTLEDEKVFENIFRRIGHSYDWNLTYSTISPKSIAISQESFLDLVHAGHAHSVEAPTMWDITFQSAIAQAEIEDKEREGFFYNIKFTVEGSDQDFTIATTRPELLPACIAIVAHPDDERYQGLFGKKAIVPLFDIPVPILASEHAEKEKGTGIMMVCTFGDAADVAWWKSSSLPIKQIIGLDGKIKDVDYGTAPFESLNAEKAKANFAPLVGLTVKKAKAQVVELLGEAGALVGEPERVLQAVKFYEKGDLPIEFVSSRQWFVKLMNQKERMVEMGRKIKWFPQHMHSRYENWVEGLNQDWCISRQRFFGVPFPVWYKIDEKGEVDYDHPIYASKDILPMDPMIAVPDGYTEDQRGKNGGFVGDKDVMDTWATSSLSPQVALAHAPEGHNLSLPFDVRPQAHDIIRTWAFYTIAKAMLHEDKIPWNGALISGFIMDPDRKKMSKSKGNVIVPIELLDKHSSDGVRYWASRAKLGVDTAFEEKVMEQGRKLVMKLFNASKFVMMIVDQSSVDLKTDYLANITAPTDKAWLARLSEATEQATKGFEKNDYSFALDAVERCFWDFCDNYLEIVKTRAYDPEDKSAVSTLVLTLDSFLVLFAPFCSFITEEIFQARSWKKADEVSVHAMKWLEASRFDGLKADNDALYEALAQVSAEIRRAKTNAGASLRAPMSQLEILGPDAVIALLTEAEIDIANVGHVAAGAISYGSADELSLGAVKVDPEEKKV